MEGDGSDEDSGGVGDECDDEDEAGVAEI